MNSTLAIISKMKELGLNADVILAVVEAAEIADSARSKNAERQARFRARKAENNVTSNATSNVTHSPLSLDKEIPPTPPKEIKPYPRENSARAKGARITGCWSPEKRDWEFAIAEIGSTAADRELSKFRDYWISKPGQGGVKLDWSATWRNWIRSAKDRLPRAGPQSKPKGDGWAEIFREANGIGEFADGFGSNSKTGDTPGPVIEGTVHGAWDRP